MNNSYSVIITISSCLTHKLKNYSWINSHLLAISGFFFFFFAQKYLLKMSAWQWVTKSPICRSTSSRQRDVLCGKHFSSTEGSSSWEPNIFTDSLASTLLILPQSMRFHEKEKAVTWALRERNSPSLSPLWMHQWMVESSWPLGHTDLVSNSDYATYQLNVPMYKLLRIWASKVSLLKQG